MLEKTNTLITKLVVNEKKMLENLEVTGGHIYSQKLLLELIKKGMTRMDAYDVVQAVSLKSAESGESFKKLVMTNDGIVKVLSRDAIENCFRPEQHLKHVDTIFKKIGLS